MSLQMCEKIVKMLNAMNFFFRHTYDVYFSLNRKYNGWWQHRNTKKKKKTGILMFLNKEHQNGKVL